MIVPNSPVIPVGFCFSQRSCSSLCEAQLYFSFKDSQIEVVRREISQLSRNKSLFQHPIDCDTLACDTSVML